MFGLIRKKVIHWPSMIRKLLLAFALVALLPSASDAQWREPPRTMQPAQQRFTDCRAVDGDTLACRQGRVVSIRGAPPSFSGEASVICSYGRS
ncbi:MAG: hypothetical protein ACK5W0_13785 [Labrys sp. (in: a-proteobacteria)]